MKAKDVVFPLDLISCYVGAPVYIDRGRFFKFFSIFRSISYVLSATYRCFNPDDLLFRYSLLLKISVIAYYVGSCAFIIFVNLKRHSIQMILDEAMKRVPRKYKLRIRRCLSVNCFIVVASVVWLRYCTIKNTDYGNGNLVQTIIVKTILPLFRDGDPLVSSTLLYMVVLEGIRASEVEMAIFSTIELSPRLIKVMLSLIERSNDLIKRFNKLLGVISFVVFGYCFILIPASIEYSKLDPNFWSWFQYVGFYDMYYILIVLVIAVHADITVRTMTETREVLYRAISLSPGIDRNEIHQAFTLLIDHRLTITTYFFDLNCPLILSFLGSLIPFSILFLQLNRNL